MNPKFSDVFSKSDWAKIIILVVVAAICWAWVFRELKKPIIPPDWRTEETTVK